MMRRYTVPSVWREMDRLQREMNRLFAEYTPNQRRAAPSYPALNAWSNENSLVITAEVPGVKSDDIDISVIGDTLTLTGMRRPDDAAEQVRYHRQERGYGKFTRTLQLPFPVDVDGVEATFKNGVLTINLPRAEEDKPRKINVRSA
jgi:HSP20 family protein